MEKPNKAINPKTEVGYAGTNTRYGNLKADEFLQDLKGQRGVKTYREMRDNDAIVGAALYAIEQTLRDVGHKLIPSDLDTNGEYVEFVESVFCDMEHSLDDHISQALSSLTYGFATFEVVYKRRKANNSLYPDGKMGVKKLATRAQWTISDFEVDENTGDLLYVKQNLGKAGYNGLIPKSKLLHYTTTNVNGDWSGRSILRNAYKSYYYLSKMQEVEAIAIEREMHGIPIGRIPAEYLSSDATDAQKAVLNAFKQGLEDIKNNEQGAIVVPSDVYMSDDGRPTQMRLMEVELLSTSGSRAIDMDMVIKRYQHDIARTLLAEFLMLGTTGTGSYALSKTKGDMFLKSLESYLNTIFEVIQRQLFPRLFELNGFDPRLAPTIVAKDVAPHDLEAIASFIRNMNGAGIDMTTHPEAIDFLFNEAAEIPYDVEAGVLAAPQGNADQNKQEDDEPEEEEEEDNG